jgi:acetoacetyl-CoA synthetase
VGLLDAPSEQPIWTPDPERLEKSLLTAFLRTVDQHDYPSLHRWSIDRPEAFWHSVWDFCKVLGDSGSKVLLDGGKMPGARWFPEAQLNFAENLLRARDESDAIVFWGEDKVTRRLSHAELYREVARWAAALKSAGVTPGDRIAAWMPNMPETVIAMLAASSLGAIFSSCSPDFGVQGVVDRFSQIEPKVLIAADGYYYNGKTIHSLEKLGAISAQLPSAKKVIVVPYVRERHDLAGTPNAQTLADFLAPHSSEAAIYFARLPFDHPLYILYSSGTTGLPKCIVHGAGGTLLQHLKEHQLHGDIQPGDRLFYFTTCGWMMWNWLVSGLASGATLLLYDGSPFLREGRILFDYADAGRMTHFGTSAKFIDAIGKTDLRPRESHRLSALRTIFSTGSPLAPEGFDYVYRHVKQNVNLASISGGTDIISCFVLGCPLLPVWRGEIQCRGLGMAVDVFDDAGRPVRGEKGELVCTRPFPSMPLGFLNDPGGKRYKSAYFEKFPGVWAHGDYAEITAHEGVIIHGRSDAVLNPGGVRIGTAEIYRQVERLPEVLEALAIGQEWAGDVRVVLFVRLSEGTALDDALTARIKQAVRDGASPRHVPARILAVADIPRTKSGKIVELAVRNVVHGRPVKNREALANPEALSLFENLPELQS